MSANELVQVVDEKDRPLRGAIKQEIWEKGLFHRIARVMVEDSEGNILVQKRVASMQLYPNCWDNSAAGHVGEGESYIQAASRELKEELGIENVHLENLGVYESHSNFEWRKMNRFNGAFKAVIDRWAQITMQDSEVAEFKWMTKAEVHNLVKNYPQNTTDGLKEIMEQFYV